MNVDVRVLMRDYDIVCQVYWHRSNSKTPFSNSKTPFSNSKTPFSNSKTAFSNSKTPFSNSKTPFADAKLFAIYRLVYTIDSFSLHWRGFP